MFRLFFVMAALTAISAVVFVASGARAQEDANFDPCAGLRGQAFGLCMSYTKGMDCSSDNPNAPQVACENVSKMFEEVSGYPPPSECPCDFSLERRNDMDQGWTGDYFACSEDPPFDPQQAFSQSKVVLDNFDDPPLTEFAWTKIYENKGRTYLECLYACDAPGCLAWRPHTEVAYSDDPYYLDRVSDFIEKYAACKGAINVLAATVNIATNHNSCVFD
jgi:hypothetical protein